MDFVCSNSEQALPLFDDQSPLIYDHDMAYQGAYYPQPWGSGLHGAHMRNPPFNPASPAFQPIGNELLQRQPRSASNPEINEMQQWMIESTSTTIMDIARVDRKGEENMQQIQQLRSMVGRDLRALQNKIKDLEHTARSSFPGTSAYVYEAEQAAEKLQTDHSRLSKRELAKALSEKAIENEAAAIRLRKRAAQLLGQSTDGPKLLEAPPVSGDKIVGFACCGTAYSAIHEMLDHIDVAHLQQLADDPSSPPPATMQVARKSLEPHSHAIKIKAPEQADFTHGAGAGSVTGQSEVVTHGHVSAVLSGSSGQAEAPWLPAAVREMKDFIGDIPINHTETFSAELLQDIFKGRDFCDGFHYMTNPLDLGGIRSYWVLDDVFQPYLPKAPGKNGAKFTLLQNEVPTPDPKDTPEPEHAMNVPVFIRTKESDEYRYFGHYSQSRFSDKIGYDTLMDVTSEELRRQWAAKLAEAGRPDWVTQMLIYHFFPRPEYWGPIPTDSAINTPATDATTSAPSVAPLERRVKDSITEYAYELKEWEKSSRAKASLLTEQEIYDSFSNADGDIVKGLRPYWEYFECVKYDQAFYKFLVHFKNNPKLAIVPSKPKPKLKETAAEREARYRQAEIEAKRPTVFVTTNGFTSEAAKKTAAGPAPRSARKTHLVSNKVWRKNDKKEDQSGSWAASESKAEESGNGWGSSETKPQDNSWGTSDTAAAAGDNWATTESKAQDNALTIGKQTYPSADKTKQAWEGYGDMNTAKQLSDAFKKHGTAGPPPPNKRKSAGVPPHLRAR